MARCGLLSLSDNYFFKADKMIVFIQSSENAKYDGAQWNYQYEVKEVMIETIIWSKN